MIFSRKLPSFFSQIGLLSLIWLSFSSGAMAQSANLAELKKSLLNDANFITQLQNKTKISQEEFEKLVENYLLNNPEILVKMQEKLTQKINNQQHDLLSQDKTTIFYNPDDAVYGNPKGKITIVEFFDYNCGYCKGSIATRDTLLKKDPNIRFVTKELPILGEDSFKVHLVSQAVRLLNPTIYPEFQTKVLAQKGRMTQERALSIAASFKLNVDALEKLIKSDSVQLHLGENLQLAQQLNLSGTPTYIIGDKVFSGALSIDNILKIIKQLHAK